MFGSGSAKPPKPPPPPELPPQLVDPVVQRAAMFARVGRWSGFAGTRVAGRWKGRSLALRVLRPGQTGFNKKQQGLVAGATTGVVGTKPSTGGTATPSVKGAVTTGGKTTVFRTIPSGNAAAKPAAGRR